MERIKCVLSRLTFANISKDNPRNEVISQAYSEIMKEIERIVNSVPETYYETSDYVNELKQKLGLYK